MDLQVTKCFLFFSTTETQKPGKKKSLLQLVYYIKKMSPVQRPDNIATMINGVERYNPENVEVLEAYLAKQCESGEYDLEANLAILKL